MANNKCDMNDNAFPKVHLFEDMVGDEGQGYMEVNSNSHSAQRQYLRLTNGIYLNEVMRIM